MRRKSGKRKEPAEKAIRDIRRAIRKPYSAEESIRIVLKGLRGEDSIAVPPPEMKSLMGKALHQIGPPNCSKPLTTDPSS